MTDQITPSDKICNTCNEVKLISEFTKNKNYKSGVSSLCLKCNNNISKKSRRAKGIKEKVVSTSDGTTKLCLDCKLFLPMESFRKNGKKNGLHSQCKICQRNKYYKAGASKLNSARYREKYREKD
jgi:hypothetical protein